jgi:2-dehydro-3-deoxyphosphooctonate aldolase (KDO 8-P synthase)
VLQTPAFLCRQTDFIHASRSGQAGEHQEGPVPAPWDMKNVVDKARERKRQRADHGLRARRELRLQQPRLRHALARDHARHRLPGRVRRDALGAAARRAGHGVGGQREFVPVLARAAVAVGIAGIFMETHPDPDKALSDGPNAWPLPKMRALLETLLELDRITKVKRISSNFARTDSLKTPDP